MRLRRITWKVSQTDRITALNCIRMSGGRVSDTDPDTWTVQW